MAFKAYDSVEQRHCVAFLMFNLNKLGFSDYGSDKRSQEIDELSIADRFYLAYQLARTFSFLHQLEFLHSDLDESSIFINPYRCQLAIIDFDGGFHFDKQAKGLTIGKIGHWVSDTLRDIIGNKRSSDTLTIKDRIADEYWKLGSGVFDLVFGVMPFFFLPDTESQTRKNYLSNFTWPYIDYYSNDFNATSFDLHRAIIEMLANVESGGGEKLVSGFKRLFNKGYDDSKKRLSGREWTLILEGINRSLSNQPLIIDFKSNKSEIVKQDEEVTVTWVAKKYNRVFVNNRLIPLHINSASVNMFSEGSITIKALNSFAEIEESLHIRALKVDPTIVVFDSSTIFRDSSEPVMLSWQTKNTDYVMLSSSSDLLPAEGSFEVNPTVETSYSLTAYGFFGQKTTMSLTVKVASPVITAFYSEINLNHGIDGVDLYWSSENTTEVNIHPGVGKVKSNGSAPVNIKEETEFTIEGVGLFSSVQSMLKVSPFPVPVIKSLLVETPKFTIESSVNGPSLTTSLTDSKLNFENSINLDVPEFKSFNGNQLVDLPDFTELEPTDQIRSNEGESPFNKAYRLINKLVSKGIDNG